MQRKLQPQELEIWYNWVEYMRNKGHQLEVKMCWRKQCGAARQEYIPLHLGIISVLL